MQIFRLIDRFSQGQIGIDNLRVFLNNFDFTCDLDNFDLVNWIRRFDKDADGKLQFVDLVNALSTMTNYQAKAVTQANADRSRLALN